MAVVTDSLQCLSPAKINHFLHITGRRQDGYHLLQTAFQFLDLYDHIELRRREDGTIARLTDFGVDPEEDLMVRAARLLQADTGSKWGVDIRIEKNIPMGAGLGGGSSNAATVLLGLDRLWGLNLSLERLLDMAAGLGADVPVFVGGRAAWAEGIGEQLTPLDLPEVYYALVVPPVHVTTAQVFTHKNLTRNQDPIKIRDFLDGEGENVCELVVFALYPEVKAAAEWLSGFGRVRMSGTGSSLFVPCQTRAEAKEIVAKMPQSWRGYAVQGLNESPMRRRDTG